MKLGLLGSLYLSQGLPYGFFTQALPVMLRKQGYSLELIGASALLAAPWALKFLWAPLVDRHRSRRAWIVPLQAITAILLVLIASFVSPDRLMWLAASFLVMNLLAATQDIATDGLAVDLLDEGERGLANGVQVAGYRVGMIVGGGALLIVFDRLGWRNTFLVMAAIIAACSLPIALSADRLRTPPPPGRSSTFFSRPRAIELLALIMTYKFGEAMAAGMIRPFLADLHLDLADIGKLLGTVGFAAGLLGALAGGALVRPLGQRRALIVCGVLQSASILGYAYAATTAPSLEVLYVLCGVEHFCVGMGTASLFTAMMRWCAPETSATDYTIQASAVVVATGVASGISGVVAANAGYPAHFVLSAIASIIAAVGIARFYPRDGEAM